MTLGYDVKALVQELKRRGITPHIARNTNGRRGAIDGRSARGESYAMSLQVQKRIEKGFGWVKTIGGLRKQQLVDIAAVRGWMTWTFAAYNLNRIGGIAEWWNPSPA